MATLKGWLLGKLTLMSCRPLRSLRKKVSWCASVIPALGRLRQEDLEFKSRLGYIARSKKKKDIS
jgi:hypothetical protein